MRDDVLYEQTCERVKKSWKRYNRRKKFLYKFWRVVYFFTLPLKKWQDDMERFIYNEHVRLRHRACGEYIDFMEAKGLKPKSFPSGPYL